MATYQYQKPYNTLNESKLISECQSAGLPVVDVQRFGDVAETMQVVTSRDLTIPEHESLALIVSNHDGRPRRARTIYSIFTDISALSAAIQNSIWLDLTSGNPPKWALDWGVNAAAIVTIQWAASVSGAAATAVNDAKRRMAAMYSQDNPAYLVNPSFAPAVNIPGDEPYTI